MSKSSVNYFDWTFPRIPPNMLLDNPHHFHFNCFAGRTTIKQGESCSAHQCAPLPNQLISSTSRPPNRPVTPPQGNHHATFLSTSGGKFPLHFMKHFLHAITVFLLYYCWELPRSYFLRIIVNYSLGLLNDLIIDEFEAASAVTDVAM